MQALRRRLRFIWRYQRGHTPWDSGIVPPEIVAWIEQAASDGTPPGRALDLGCGTGTTSIYLAEHGWQTLGVDFAPNAIRRARRKARGRAVPGSLTFISADVSRPDFLAGVNGFDLAVDVGCLHSIALDLRPGYAANAARLLRPGASLLLYAFQPDLTSERWRRQGIDFEGMNALLAPAFEIVTYTPGEETTTPRPSAWYALRRVETDL